MDRPTVLLSDANVLIDYRDSDLSILALACEHIGPIRVVHEVLEEVEGLTAQACAELGIVVVDVEPELLLEIAALPRRLSRADRLSFLVCRNSDWICLTNDVRLRDACTQHQIRLRWGLELMVDLVRAGALTASRALEVGGIIRANNPLHIKEAVFAAFAEKISDFW